MKGPSDQLWCAAGRHGFESIAEGDTIISSLAMRLHSFISAASSFFWGVCMELRIFEGEGPVGRLSVSVQGLYTLFEARVAGEGTGLSRLWLLGKEGDPASLGLLEPRAGERLLRRRLSRLERQKLPPEPWTALILPAEEQALASPSLSLRTGDRRAWCGNPHSRPGDEENGLPRQCAHCLAMTEPAASASGEAPGPGVKTEGPPPNSEFRTPNSELPWLHLPDGSLYDPAQRLLALPWAGGELPAGARKISVDGRDYLVFRY